ncbi:hypothetical protein BC940DRAFT_324772 [Gongronella butleri]|nr:hypothetical protein BC940DRAFT_324772 [Gongronella butleri]
MAAAIAVIYSSQLGAEAVDGDVQRRFPETDPNAMQAASDAEAAMAYCRDEVLPELDLVDDGVIRPSLEAIEIIKKIQKTILKRNHKMIDYDRHRSSLAKLKTKNERSMNEEKQVYKVQSQLEIATQDYDYLNDMLKEQLPHFLDMQAALIRPISERLYFMQCRIYGMIYARCHELLHANEQHFVTFQMGIEQGHQWRITNDPSRNEIENLDLLKAGGKAWLKGSGGATSSKLSLRERAELRDQPGESPSMSAASPPPAYGGLTSPSPSSTPTYQQSPVSSYQSPTSAYQAPSYQSPPPAAAPAWNQPAYQAAASVQSSGSTRRAPPPPPPLAAKPKPMKYVIALYDYDAQAEGDLSFRKDDRIALIERTADTNDWWTGELNGVRGVFPGNYCQEV